MGVLKAMNNRKKTRRTCEELREDIKNRKNGHGSAVPAWVRESYDVTDLTVEKCPCYIIKQKKNFSDRYIFFIYGSGLCFDMSKKQWNFILDMAERTKMGLVIPIYPLAPEKCCQDVFDMIIPAYRDFSISRGIDQISIMGEGAGAGIALSLAIQIWKEGYRKPDHIVLLSPSLDTEFFDTGLEQKMRDYRGSGDIFFSDGIKEFLNRYWVKDYAVRTEFTSPIYEDFTDLCDDILVISGTQDMLNCYARSFYDKAIRNGINVKYFEYKDMPHQFYLNKRYNEAIHARKVMTDVLRGRRDAVFNQYMYEIKQRGEWTKRFPEVFKDEIAVKYLCNNRITYEKYRKQNDYHKLLSAARLHGFDEAVKKFLREYPNGTVVYLGCSLDTMFERTDNGRVLWYNCDSPGKISVRRIYVADKEREKTVDKSLHDEDWMDEIKCDMGHGLMFVCMDFFSYFKSNEVKEFIDRLYQKFPGCQVLFDVSSYRSIVASNLYNRSKEMNFKKRRFYMNDVERGVAAWNTVYRVISENSILNEIEISPQWNGILKLKFKYDNYNKNYKLVHLRLGNEKYQTEVVV